MRLKLLFLTLLVMLATMLPARAETLTVYDGMDEAYYAPAYIFYWDDYTRSECVIPASSLQDMAGGTITALTFYTNQNSALTTKSDCDFYLKEVSYSSISAYETKESCTIVYSGKLTIGSDGQTTITLNQPFTYNGANLLIGSENVTKAGGNSVKFKGQIVDGSCIAGNNVNSASSAPATQRNFIPKTTFTYTTPYPKPTNLTVGNIGANEATVSWTPGSTETSWNVEYKKASEASWASAGAVTSPSITLDVLENNTNYDVRVQADYGSGNLSNWATASFTTAICDPADMGEITFDIYDAIGDGWSNDVSLQIVSHSSDIVVQELTVASASGTNHITGTINLCYGVDYDLVWVGNSIFTYECGFTLLDTEGNIIYEHKGTGDGGTTITPGTLTTFHIKRDIYDKPTDLAVNDIIARSAYASWTGNNDAVSYDLRYRMTAGTAKHLYESFETFPHGWTVIDSDGDGNNWKIFNPHEFDEEFHAYDGSYGVMSRSWIDGHDYSPDNWLISPKIDLGGELEYYVMDDGYNQERYCIYVSTTGTDIDDFVQLTNLRVSPASTTWEVRTADLSAYKGQRGYIAFRHYNSTGADFMMIDAVSIRESHGAGEWITVSPATCPQKITGLDPETGYEVEVRAVYADETSYWTNSVSFTTLAADAMPTDLAVNNATRDSGYATWNGVQESYNLRYRKNTFFENFDSGVPSTWTTIDNDCDNHNWFAPDNGNCVASESYNNSVGALTPDNWLITPQVTLGELVTFDAWGQDPGYYSEVFSVLVSTTGTAVADFTAITPDITATIDRTTYSFDVSQYAGQQGYVAIRHYNCSNYYRLNVDNFAIGGNWHTASGVTSPYTITGLDPETDYEVQVQGVIDDETNTSWAPSTVFTTLGIGVAGDVNGDGEVTSFDITALYNLLLLNDSSDIVNGDQNGDGEINSADVTTVYSILLTMSSSEAMSSKKAASSLCP